MKNIRLTVDPPNSELTHEATSWQVSTTTQFTTNMLINVVRDEVNLLEYVTDIDIGDNDTVYIRSKYHFDTGDSNWSRVISLHGKQSNLALSDTIVETPNVSIDIDYSNNVDGELIVSTSPFQLYAGGGMHKSTSWRIHDLDGRVLYERERDIDNLVKLKIPNIDPERAKVISAQHHSDADSSEIGVYVKLTNIRVTKVYDLILLKEFISGRPINFKLNLFTSRFSTLEIKIEDGNEQVISHVTGITDLDPELDTTGLTVLSNYTISSRIKLDDGTYTEYKIIYQGVLNKNYLNNFKQSQTYLDKFDFTQQFIQGGYSVQNSTETYDNIILLGVPNSRNINKYKLNAGKLVQTGVAIELPVDHELNLPYLNVLPLYEGGVVINYTIGDSSSSYRKTYFRKYDYNPSNQVFTEVASLECPYDALPTSLSSSAVVSRDGHIYYIPAVQIDGSSNLMDLSLYKINISTFTRTKVTNLPFAATRHVSLSIKQNNDLIILGGSNQVQHDLTTWKRVNNDVYNYNISTNTFTAIAQLPVGHPVEVYNQQTVLRRDGRVVIFNGSLGGSEIGNQDTVVYDPYDNTVTEVASDYHDDLAYLNSIYLQNGNIIRISSKHADPQNVYTYISDTMSVDDIDTSPDAQVTMNEMEVNGNRIISIMNPYLYDKVTIEPGSTLKWLTKDEVRNFQDKDWLVTRDTTTTNADVDTAGYETISVLVGATLSIQPDA